MQQQVAIMPEKLIEVRENNISNAEWEQINPKDLWIYNKLELSRRLEYICGPSGVSVPTPGHYIVRPVINFSGMSRHSRIEWLDCSTDHLHPGEFWCEILAGEHLSVDFYEKSPKLIVKGHKNPKNPLYKWNCWTKVNRNIEFPDILNDLIEKYSVINCEFIQNKLIEVQIRPNLDFRWGNSVSIPVWKGTNLSLPAEFKFVKDEDYHRIGFFIK